MIRRWHEVRMKKAYSCVTAPVRIIHRYFTGGVVSRLERALRPNSSFAGRKKDRNGRAAFFGTSHRYFSVMQLHELGYDGEPEATAAVSACARGISPKVWLENAEKIFP